MGVPLGCTGYRDDDHGGAIRHDGDTCPVHEAVPLDRVLATLRAERDHYARRSERIQALADGDRIDPLGTRLYEAEYAVGAQWGLALAISAIQKEVLDA